MGILNSVALGKSRGKAGNIVFSNLKGQTVFKQLNEAPANPQSLAQMKNRIQLANTVAVYKLTAPWLVGYKYAAGKLESTYNAFTKLFKPSYATVITSLPFTKMSDYVMNPFESILANEGLSYGTSNTAEVLTVTSGVANVVVAINANARPWNAAIYVNVISFDTDHEIIAVARVAVANGEWTAGTITVPLALAGAQMSAAYLEDASNGANSNIKFSAFV